MAEQNRTEGNQKLTREDRDAIRKHLTDEREEPLHTQMRRTAYSLVGIPRPDQPLTDDQAADVIAAAHLMMRAAYRLEDADARQTRDRRRTRAVTVAVLVVAVAALVVCAVGITLDATH